MKKQSTIQNRRGVSTVVGGFIFLVLMIGALTAIIIAMQAQFDLFYTEKTVSDHQIEKWRENFELSAACVDTSNNRLFVEVENTGSVPVELADLWIMNTTVSSLPANLYEINYTDSFIPFGFTESVLINQPLFMNNGTYDIKVVSYLGRMDSIKNFTVDPLLPP